MQTCPITTLKIHSSGQNYSPLLVAGLWKLKNIGGDVLTGYRGKEYEFLSEKSAKNWLCTNLSRFKNATAPTDIDYLIGLGKIYTETGFAPCLLDIENIYDYEHGLWQIVECGGDVQYIEVEAVVDYDGGDANGLTN